jgi:hypothetical protein
MYLCLYTNTHMHIYTNVPKWETEFKFLNLIDTLSVSSLHVYLYIHICGYVYICIYTYSNLYIYIPK